MTADGIGSLVVITVFGILYMVYASHRFFVDGLTDAYLIETSDKWLFHSYHDLFPFFPQLIYKILAKFTRGVSALGFLQVWGSFFGVIAAWGMMLVLRELKLSWWAVAVCLGLYGFSSGVWYFSSTASQYSTALALHVFSLLLLLKSIKHADSPRFYKQTFGLGAVISLANFAHASNFFALISVAYFHRFVKTETRDRSKTLYSLLAGIASVLVIFWAVKLILGHVFPIFDQNDQQYRYILAANYWPRSLMDAVIRSFHGLVELHVAHAFHPGGLFASWNGAGMSILLRAGQLIILVGVFLLSFWGIFNAPGKNRDIFTLILRSIFIMIFIGCLIFVPQSTNYRIFYMPSLITLIAMVLNPWIGSGRSGIKLASLILLVLLMFTVNFTVKFLPESNMETNPDVAEAGMLSNLVGPGDLVIYSGKPEDHLKAQYVRYFTHADILTVPQFAGMLKGNKEELIDDLENRTEAGYSILIHENVLEEDENYSGVAPVLTDLPSYDVLREFFDENLEYVTHFEVNDREYFVIVPKTPADPVGTME